MSTENAALEAIAAAVNIAASPYANTLVFGGLNGAQKCLADAADYDAVKYGTINTFFARGEAERFTAALGEALRSLANPVKITAYTDAFPDGQKTVAAILEYPAVLNGPVAPAWFAVEKRTVTAARVSDRPEPEAEAGPGRYVILTLDPADADAYVLSDSGRGGNKHTGPGGPGGPGGPDGSGGPGGL